MTSTLSPEQRTTNTPAIPQTIVAPVVTEIERPKLTETMGPLPLSLADILNGGKIGYASPLENSQIFVVDADRVATPITNNDVTNYSPQFSPDGRTLAYVSHAYHKPYEIYLYDYYEKTTQLLAQAPRDIKCCLSWSPESNQIAFITLNANNDRQWDIDVINIDGSHRETITSVYASLDPILYINNLSWSPDGDWLSYTAHEAGPGRWIYLVDMANRQTSLFLENVDGLVWSPDSTRVAFMTTDQPGSLDDIYVMNIDGTGLQRLTNTPEIDEGLQVWSPDGKYLIWGRFEGDDVPVNYLLALDGSVNQKLIDGMSITWGIAWP